MKSADYWKKRMESIEDMSHSKGVAYANNVEQQFRQAESAIDAKIERWYQRLADINEISLSAAKKLLNDDELEDFHMDINEYIRKGKTLPYDDKWAKQLENASAKVHISRLEAMKLQMQQQCEELYGNMTDGLDAHLRDVYTNGYYHTAYEIQRGLNVGWGFNKLDNRKIEKAINSCWTNDGKTFKARCWTNKEKLVNELNTVLTQNIIRGEDPQKAINALAHRMKVSKYNAGRLIMTESAAISSMSQHDCFKELDVKEFEFVATLDSHTSEICRAMDGKHFKMSDYTIGLNAPPLHCFCRSCTVPYFADDVGERIARREDGSTYYVSSDTTYEKWIKTAISGNNTGNIASAIANTLISSKIKDIVDQMPKPDEVKTNADKKSFAKSLLEKLGIDTSKIDVSVKKMRVFGGCLYRNTGSDTADYFEYALRSDDMRDMSYQIKTAYHEAFHMKLNGHKWDLNTSAKKWTAIEETFAESAAHYAASLQNITNLTPSYADKLVRVLPRLKRLPEYADCSSISDFGKIAWEERLQGNGGVWKDLYDRAFADRFDKSYYKQYFDYMNDNKEEMVDKLLEIMPEYKTFKPEMMDEFDNAMNRIKDTGNIDALTGNEKIVFDSALIAAMNVKGI